MKSVMVVVKNCMCEYDKNTEEYIRTSYGNENARYFEDLKMAKEWMVKEFKYCDAPVRMYLDSKDGITYVVGYIYPYKHKENEDYEDYWVSFYWIETLRFEEDLVDVADD
jgi:hypothetical protein